MGMRRTRGAKLLPGSLLCLHSGSFGDSHRSAPDRQSTFVVTPFDDQDAFSGGTAAGCKGAMLGLSHQWK
jgi:hypothetical protein